MDLAYSFRGLAHSHHSIRLGAWEFYICIHREQEERDTSIWLRLLNPQSPPPMTLPPKRPHLLILLSSATPADWEFKYTGLWRPFLCRSPQMTKEKTDIEYIPSQKKGKKMKISLVRAWSGDNKGKKQRHQCCWSPSWLPFRPLPTFKMPALV